MSKQGLLLIISGPSGVGKSTITAQVVERLDAVFSVSLTTRPITSADVEGRDYFFVTESQFMERVEAGDLLEWAQYSGHYYGTPRKPVEQAIAQGRVVVLEIDVAGAEQIKQLKPESYALFVLPPSEGELLNRLRRRQREPEDVIQQRFAIAKSEIARAHACGAYDAFIVNDQLDGAIDEAIRLVQSKRQRQESRGMAD